MKKQSRYRDKEYKTSLFVEDISQNSYVNMVKFSKLYPHLATSRFLCQHKFVEKYLAYVSQK